MREFMIFLTEVWSNPASIPGETWGGLICFLIVFCLGFYYFLLQPLLFNKPCSRCGNGTQLKNEDGPFCCKCSQEDGLKKSNELLKGMSLLMRNCNCPKCGKLMKNKVKAECEPVSNCFTMMMQGVTAESFCAGCNTIILFDNHEVDELHEKYRASNKKE